MTFIRMPASCAQSLASRAFRLRANVVETQPGLKSWYVPNETAKPARKRPLAPLIWFSAPLAAAAAALAIGFFAFRPAAPQASVESGDASVSTIAYVDKDSGWLVVWAADADTKSNG